MSFIEKTPIQSKKFIFALFSLLILAGVIVVIALTQTITWPISVALTMLSIGLIVIPVGYVLGQAAIDKVAAMVGSVSHIFGGDNNDSDSKKNME